MFFDVTGTNETKPTGCSHLMYQQVFIVKDDKRPFLEVVL
jgi:hypothetical protein